MNFDLLGIFAAGLLTFASPCILPLVPIYLALLAGASAGELAQGRRAGRAVVSAVGFAVGLSFVFVGLGMAATGMGRLLVAHRALLLQLGGLAVFLFGLKYLGVLHIPWLEREVRPWMGRKASGGLLGGAVFGATFGLGWTPCIGPVLGSVLTFTATTATRPEIGALYLGAYALGLSLPLLTVAAVAPLALGWIKRLQRHLQKMQMATGAVLAIVGLLLLTDSLGALDPTNIAAARGPRAVPALAGGTASAEGAACGAPTAAFAACGPPSDAVEAESAGAAQAFAGGPAMIAFVSGSCPICLRMAPIVAAAERGCAGHKVAVERIRVDAPGGRELARRYGVLGLPTFVFVDEFGNEVSRLVGEQSLAALEQTLSVLAGEDCEGFCAFPGERDRSEPAEEGAPSAAPPLG
ncbi:MAG: cytochrome c biogenesis protein CcdA [Myxococcales bacterium]|jgi:cytochrome c-type biogenesis protein